MGIWGKIIGGVAGMAVGGPLGGILGAAAGHAVDRIRGETRFAAGPDLGQTTGGRPGGFFGVYAEQARRVTFSVAVVVLAAKMAKVDGHVTRDEVDAFKRLFQVPPDEMANVGRLFDAARASADGFEIYARQIATLFADRPELLEEVLDALFAIAVADGELHDSERDFLDRVAAIFGMQEKEFDRVEATFTGGADPYQVLGIARSASAEEIKAAYRRLIREHHPDTLVGRGLPEEFIEVANRKMAAINAAFDQIMRQKGLK